MTIALDATYSLGGELSGVGIYSRAILFGLAKAHAGERLEFWYRPHRYLPSWRETLPGNVRRRLLAGPFGPHAADLFHGLNQRLPTGRLRRAVTTFHDLFVLSGEYSTPEFRARFAAQARDAAGRADLIIAVSEFTKSQITGLLGVAQEKIRVVHHGARPLAVPSLPREKLILSVGAIQKRKNLARLVEAFEALPTDWQMVLAGSDGFGAGEIRARIQASAARDRIQVTGYVSDDALARWYARASIFAFPSLDEGFGMPVLEAMTAGVPVLTSNRSALPEVAGDAALLVDPESAESITTALRELAEHPDRRMDLARRGRDRASTFTWEKAVRETWDVYDLFR
ncbi:MAG TPA: glycosyltransferase family 1 protein [Bryobacteraceae bacterium]